jgi:hypothetical protein
MADERRRTVLRQAYEMARSGDFAKASGEGRVSSAH